MFKPNYNELEEISYLNRKSPEVYDIPFSTFLPTFIIIDNGQCVDDFWNSDDLTFNNNEYWKWQYEQYNDDNTTKNITVVNCYDMIQKWTDISDQEK